MHIILNAPCAAFASAVLGHIIRADFTEIIYMVLLSVAYVMFSASFGLFLNLKSPNLTWTNETVPVKQSAAVGIGLFGGWSVSLAIGGIGFLLRDKIDMMNYNLICAIILIFAARFINKWIDTKGAEIFKSL